MKKLLIAALLILALVFTVAACTGDNPEETSAGDTTVETPTTEAPTAEATEEPTAEATEDASADVTTEEPVADTTEEPVADTTEEPVADTTEEPAPDTTKEPETTEEPTADPADPVLLLNPEDLNTLATGAAPNANEVASSEVITEGKKTFLRLTAAGGDPYVAIVPINSNCDLPNYMAISYRTNSAVEGQFFVGSGQGWTGNGDSFMVTWTEGDWSFMIVDLSQTGVNSITGALTYLRMDFFAGDSAEGDYFDIQYIGFFNSVAYAEAYDFEINPPYAEPADAGLKALSFDTFYVNGQMYFEVDGGAGDKLDAINNTLTFASASELQNLALRGWIGFDQPIDQFGYYVDNYEFIFGDFKQATEAGVLQAGGENASRFQINVDLSALKGDDHFVGFVVKLEDGTIVKLRANITIDLPELPKDITDTFISDVASNEDGTDLQASDLANFFIVQYGAADPHSVTGGAYVYGGINEMYADVNGKYAYSVNMISADLTAMMFVRGTHVIHSVDVPVAADGLYPINNYYETDGNGHMGGAGVYAAIYGGNLNIVVKVYNPDNKTHIGLKTYAVPTDATELTIADDGETLYFIAGGKLLATIALSGEATYETLDMIQPEVAFAKTAVVTLADGTTETIENTLVAATCASQIGIAVRPAAIKFDSLKVQAFSAIEIPEFEGGETVVPQNTNLFQSNVSSFAPGTRFDATDLNSNGMTCFLPLADYCYTEDMDEDGTADAYYLSSINEFFGTVNGAYSFSANFLPTAGSGSSMMIVRGYRSVTSADYAGPYHINNYYEDDGTGFFAGAGIGTTMQGNVLYVCIKAYDEAAEKHVKNVILNTPATGSTITVADNGNTVYVLVDGVLCATVEISGETSYEKITAAGSFAQSVTVTMANGSTETVENTLVASNFSEVAMATRNGNLRFTSVKVGTFDEVEIPVEEEPETPVEPETPAVETYNVPMESWTISGHQAQLITPDVAGVGPIVAAAGMDKAALLHQGSVGVGEVDLSKYSKVIVKYTTDASQATYDLYEASGKQMYVLNADMHMAMSPDAATVVTSATFTLPELNQSWKMQTIEIDLTAVDYSGNVYIAWDTLAGSFMVIASVEFVA